MKYALKVLGSIREARGRMQHTIKHMRYKSVSDLLFHHLHHQRFHLLPGTSNVHIPASIQSIFIRKKKKNLNSAPDLISDIREGV